MTDLECLIATTSLLLYQKSFFGKADKPCRRAFETGYPLIPRGIAFQRHISFRRRDERPRGGTSRTFENSEDLKKAEWAGPGLKKITRALQSRKEKKSELGDAPNHYLLH